jgi:hypothetical protein
MTGSRYHHCSSLIWAALICAIFFSSAAVGQETVAPKIVANELPLYVKVHLDKAVKLSSLRPGDVAEGDLARDVYSPDGKIFSAGSRVRLTVDHMERRRKPKSNAWPWIVKFFMPRHENFPAFHEALVSTPDATQATLQVSLISAGSMTNVRIQPAKKKKAKDEDVAAASLTPPSTDVASQSAARGLSNRFSGTTLSLEARTEPGEPAAPVVATPIQANAGAVTLPAGTPCHILLLDALSSSKSRVGDSFRARLLEPVILDSKVVLPAGTMFEGKVTKATPPRWLSRAGNITPIFTTVTMPDGSHEPASASVLAVEVDHSMHTKIDAEGRLHGDRPGVAWMLINGGVTAGIAKEVDDGTQLVIEAIISSATDASTAGTARIVGTVASTIFMLTRHGRDVVIPRLTEMDIVLNRPLTLTPSASLRTTRATLNQ